MIDHRLLFAPVGINWYSCGYVNTYDSSYYDFHLAYTLSQTNFTFIAVCHYPVYSGPYNYPIPSWLPD